MRQWVAVSPGDRRRPSPAPTKIERSIYLASAYIDRSIHDDRIAVFAVSMKDRAISATRQRLLRAGEQLFRTQGYAATGLKQLTAAAQAPWGSMYHFFPGGKEELGSAILGYAGEFYRAGWQAAFDRHGDPARAIEWIFLAEVRVLESSDYRNGCPVASVTMDIASTSEALRGACAKAFAAWLAAIEGAFAAAGAPRADAADLAGFVLSALEGAIVLSRAAKRPETLVQSARFVRQVVEREAQKWRKDDKG
jgi:AcrR family transcriptional regulator